LPSPVPGRLDSVSCGQQSTITTSYDCNLCRMNLICRLHQHRGKSTHHLRQPWSPSSMLLTQECAITTAWPVRRYRCSCPRPPCEVSLVVSRTPARQPSSDPDRILTIFNLATLGVTISPLPRIPRSPTTTAATFLDRPWEDRESSDYSSHGIDPGPLSWWRRGVGGIAQQDGRWLYTGQHQQQQQRQHQNHYMSQSSPTAAERSSSFTSPRTLGPVGGPASGSALSTDSSRPSTASASRPEGHGPFPGPASARAQIEAGAPQDERRRSPESAFQTPSRSLGVQSILNPPSESEERNEVVKRGLAQSMSITQTLIPPAFPSPRSRKRTEPASPVQEPERPSSARLGRRLLTPKSPGFRAAGLGARRNPTFHSTGDTLHALSGSIHRTYTADPNPYRNPEIPPLPTLGLTSRPPLPPVCGTPESLLPPAFAPGHVSHAPGAVESGPSSQIESSGVSQASYPKPEQMSPIFRFGMAPPPPPPSQGPSAAFRALAASASGGFGREGQVHGPHEGYQQGSASYQMTLDTDQGPMVVPVELDLQQASKVADEKRKRNAGASARFRARRKEKEKEASQTIAGLQQELRDLVEEREFYRAERNYFRDLATRNLPSTQIPPRPPSPQSRRMAAAPAPAPATENNAAITEEQYHDRSDSASTIQRRRTADYQPSFLGGQQTRSPPGAYGGSFQSQPPLSLPPPPPAYGSPRALPPGPPPPPPTPRSQSYDPFRRDPFERSWNPGR